MPMTKKVICGMLCAGLLLLTGCGEKLKSLTAEEEDIVSMYAAKVVAKHNVRLGQGVMRYRGKIEDEEEAEEEETEEAKEEETEEAEAEESSSQGESATSQTGEESETEDTQASGQQENTSTSQQGEKAAQKEQAPAISEATLSDALGMKGIHFAFDGAKVPDTLRLNSYYTLPDPQAGMQYVMASFDAINETQSALQVSVADLAPKFQATLGGQTVNAGMVLDQDLMTYSGTIEAGGSEHLILLFSFPKDVTTDLSDFSLMVDVKGKKSKVLLR